MTRMMKAMLFALGVSTAALSVPAPGYAQGELSQCRSYGKEREYPCRVPGHIVRSERDHLRFSRLQHRYNNQFPKHIGRDREYRDDLARELLKRLLDK